MINPSVAQELKFRVGKINYTGISIDELRFEAFGEPTVNQALIGLKQIKLAKYPKSHLISPLILNCHQLEYSSQKVDCKSGILQLKDNKIPIKFQYEMTSKRLETTLSPSPKEQWHIIFQQFSDQSYSIEINLKQANLQRLIPYVSMPKNLQFKQGLLDGYIKIKAKNNNIIDIKSNIDLSDVNFSDAEGFNAVEQLKLKLSVDGELNLNQSLLDLTGKLAYESGQAYFQPIYFASGGHQFDFKLNYNINNKILYLDRLNGNFKNIGSLILQSTVFNIAKNSLQSLDLKTSDLEFKQAYLTFLQPILGQSILSQLNPDSLKGNISVQTQIKNQQIEQANIQLNQVSFADKQKRFAINNLNILIPYDKNKYKQGHLALNSLQIHDITIPKIQTQFDINQNKTASDIDITIPRLKISLFGGDLDINDFKLIYDTLKPQGDNIEWQFSANLSPISMNQMTQAFDIPLMNGTLSSNIPKISYKNHEINVDGAIEADLFDGHLIMNQMKLYEPFGRIPRLLANIHLKNIDLDLLTRSFEIGNITGKIDIDINQLELNTWKPVSFDLAIKTSEGNFKKKLSQKAVQNIASLNGGGISSALQRRALGFFDSFSYDKIGLSCEMRFGLCKMSGIEPADQGGYYLIKGAGIPRLNIIGYNRLVDWEDFVSRVQSVIENQKTAN